MAKRNFYIDLDLNQNSLLKAKLENSAVAPSAPVKGQIYFDTVLNQIGVCTNNVGPVWLYAGSIKNILGTSPINVSIDGSGVATISISAATTLAAGSMSPSDKLKLDSATALNTASTIVSRDGSGNFAANAITGLATPVNPGDAANKSYVDAMSYGLNIKGAVRTIATSNVASLSGVGSIVNGVTLVADDRILLTSQSTTTQDGIYVVKSGAWVRSSDFAIGSSVANAFMFVEEGTYADTGWVCTNNTGSAVVGTNDLVFVQFSSAGVILAGIALSKTGNTLDVLNDTNHITINGSNQLTIGNYVSKVASATVTLGTAIGVVTITHNFNTLNVSVQAIDVTTGEHVEISTINTTVNTITVEALGSNRSIGIVITGNIGLTL